jgi:ABC-type nickel/cobalt efflux system permease component RcnA
MLETLPSAGTLVVLGIGLLFGLKHATEVDHIVAVSTIASRHKSVLSSTLVGGLWGIGHTAALLITGAFVLSFRVVIPARVSSWLEFAVALMIIGLGLNALWRSLRKPEQLHLHRHSHDGVTHTHVHFHERQTLHGKDLHHNHAVSQIGWKPLLVGVVHGLAGSGALTLLVLTQIKSPVLGFIYLVVFGVGSILGMLLMTGLIGLPFALTSEKLSGVHNRLQFAAASLSIAFGCWYAYQTGFLPGTF